MDRFGGWTTCQDLTSTLRAAKPEAIQIAEYWPVNDWVVRDRGAGGAGFDATWHDGLRQQRARGDLKRGPRRGGPRADVGNRGRHRERRVAQSLACGAAIENHDIVYAGREPRIARLGDGDDPRSWYARSRSRVATGLMLTSPGIPMLFMGQEFLADKPWTIRRAADTSIDWTVLDRGDKYRRLSCALCGN